ncbi:MAG: HAMP domain-containing protein [Ruminiclostridium sp.]
MKKIIVFSLILAIIAGIAGSLLFGLTPSQYILEFSVNGENSLYTISQYTHGVYLKKSDKNGIIFSHRLKYQNSGYCGLITNNDRLYTLVLDGSDVVVDEYDLNGNYITEMLRLPNTPFTTSSAALVQYFDETQDSATKLVTDVVMFTYSDVFIYPIYGDTVQPLIHYSIDSEYGIVWAQRLFRSLYYMDQQGDIFIVTEQGNTHKLDISDEFVPFDLTLSYYSLFFTNLSDTSLMRFFVMCYEEDGEEQIYYDVPVQVMPADSEVYNGVAFSELRDLKNFINTDFDDLMAGVSKEANKAGKIYIFNPITAMNVELPEPGFEPHVCLLVFLLCTAVVFAAVFIVCVLIRLLLSVRKVIVKQVMLIAAIIVAVSGLIHFFLLRGMSMIVYSETAALLSDTLDLIDLSIDGNYFSKNGLTEEQRALFHDYEYREYKALDNKSDFMSRFISTDIEINFIEVARLIDGEYKYEYYSNQRPGAQVSYFVDEKRLELFSNLTNGTDVISNSYELDTSWFEAVRCITDSSGKQVGFIQIGSEAGTLNTRIKSIAGAMTYIIMMFIVVISGFFLIIMAGLLRPLKKLKKAVSEVADGKIGTTVTISSNDELQDVAASFSDMSRQLAKYFNSINVISKAYEKYLPKDFFRLMGKDSVLDVNPGDHSTARLTYLFIGISRQSDKFSEEESFNTLNSIYSIAAEVLSGTNGTVQSFTDKMITCIFSGEAAEAAECALTVQEKLNSRSDINAHITVSIQSSPSVIGVIGSGEAMKTITVSSAVELQSCLTAIIQRFGLTFIVTEEVLSELQKAGLNITPRRLGTINLLLGADVKQDAMLYEIIDGCPDEEKKLRHATLRNYSDAISAMDENRLSEARAKLISVLRVNRNDLVARFMLSEISGEREASDNERNQDRLEIPN